MWKWIKMLKECKNLPANVTFQCGIGMEEGGKVAGSWGNMYLSFICVILFTLRANIHSKYCASYKPLIQNAVYEFSMFNVYVCLSVLENFLNSVFKL